jgi:hypothetical protein
MHTEHVITVTLWTSLLSFLFTEWHLINNRIRKAGMYVLTNYGEGHGLILKKA